MWVHGRWQGGPGWQHTHTHTHSVGGSARETSAYGLGHARKHCTTLYWVSVCVCVAKMAGCVSTCKDEKEVYMYVKGVVRSAKIQSTSLCVSLCIRLVALLVFFGILQVCRYAYFSFEWTMLGVQHLLMSKLCKYTLTLNVLLGGIECWCPTLSLRRIVGF